MNAAKRRAEPQSCYEKPQKGFEERRALEMVWKAQKRLLKGLGVVKNPREGVEGAVYT